MLSLGEGEHDLVKPSASVVREHGDVRRTRADALSLPFARTDYDDGLSLAVKQTL